MNGETMPQPIPPHNRTKPMVLSWFVFVFVGWFLTTIYSLSTALTNLAAAQKGKSHEAPAAWPNRFGKTKNARCRHLASGVFRMD
jgi:hypothetical protein